MFWNINYWKNRLVKAKPMFTHTLKNFVVQEFVDHVTYNNRGEQALQLIDCRILWSADAIREFFDAPMTINNWHVGGNREWSGLRTSRSEYYSQYSQHSFGRAIDFFIDGIDSGEIRSYIISHPEEPAFKYITGIEEFQGMSWVHLDCRTLLPNQNRYLIFGK